MFWVWSLGSLLNRFRTLGSFRCSIRWPPPLSWTTSRIRTKKHPAMMTKGIKTDKAMAVLIPAFRRLYTFWADEALVLNPLTLKNTKEILTDTFSIAVLGPIPISGFIAPTSTFTHQDVSWIAIELDHGTRSESKSTFTPIGRCTKCSTRYDWWTKLINLRIKLNWKSVPLADGLSTPSRMLTNWSW